MGVDMEHSASDTNFKPDEDGLIRLQKLLAHRGLASRRNAEEMIRGGLVKVNGIVVTVPGTKVHPESDRVTVDGKTVPVEPEPFLFLFYKPKGVVSTLHDPDGKTTLKDFFPRINPLIHVGRLDIQSEGVLLLTNNGDMAQRILHPRYQIPRTYLVKVQGVVTPEHLDRLRSGKIRLDGRPVQPLEVEQERLTETNSWYRITLTEGRNREVRRLFDALNYFVLKLTRIAFGNLDLSGLEPGEYRLVTPEETDLLLSGARWKKKDPTPPPVKSSRRTGPSSNTGSDSSRQPFRSRATPSDPFVQAPVEGDQGEEHGPNQTGKGIRLRPDSRFRATDDRSGTRRSFGERSRHSGKNNQSDPSFQKSRFPYPGNHNDKRRTNPDNDPNIRMSERRDPRKNESSFGEDRRRFSEEHGRGRRSGPSFRREDDRSSRQFDTSRHRKDSREDSFRSSEHSGANRRSGPSFRRQDDRSPRYPGSPQQKRASREDNPHKTSSRGTSSFSNSTEKSQGTGRARGDRETPARHSRKPGSSPRDRKGPGKNHPHHS